jgi:hypothetical protein
MRTDNNCPHPLFTYTDANAVIKNQYPHMRVVVLKEANSVINHIRISYIYIYTPLKRRRFRFGHFVTFRLC